MSIDNIKTSLEKLRSTLESNGAVDNELKTLLQTLDTDIQQLLKSPGTAPARSASTARTSAWSSAAMSCSPRARLSLRQRSPM